MSQPSKKRVSTKCTKCGNKNFVRKDYLKALKHPYWCRYCVCRWKPATFEDKIRLSLSHRKHNLNESFFKKINNEKKAYWLGFLAGDATIVENKVKLRLSIKDEEHLAKFKKAVEWTGKDYYDKKTRSLEVYFRSFTMTRDLERYYISPRKTFTIRFPKIPKRLERHFIRGAFDADGCINRARRVTQKKSGKIYVFYGGEFNIEGNKKFVSAIQLRLVNLGLSFTSLNYSGKSINRVRYGGINQLRKIYDYLYNNADIFLERKKELYENILRDYRCEIIK